MVFGHRYRATEKIGTGGMADVYKAVDETLGRTVAIKVLHQRYATDPNFAARFRQEAQAAANLQSPNIVNIYDWGQDGDTYYIVMEYVRGTDLKQILTQKGPLSTRRCAELGAQVCAALAVAHNYDIIHRDIKPHNIMVTPDGSVKVMDFGIARATNSTMTQTGSVLGTAHYVSPEQAQGRELRAQSDLYSLGVVLYECATGTLPFDADTPVAVALKHVNEQPVRPTKVNPKVSPDLERIIGRALAKDPAKRYSTAEEMRQDLLRLTGQGATTTVMPAAVPGGGMSAPDHTAVLPAVGGGDVYPTSPGVRPVTRKRPVWPWLILAALLIAAGLVAAYTLGLFETGVMVPTLVGMRQTEAEAVIADSGFALGKVTKEYSDAPSGEVIEQSPFANALAEKGSTINLTVSQGPELVEVPDLVGLQESEVGAALAAVGLEGEPQPDEYNAKIPAGQVIRQTPEAGDEAVKGTQVHYVVSRGIETTSVPNVVGLARSDAASILRKAGFDVNVTEQFDTKVAKGKVISQSPSKGTVIAIGSAISMVVSRGPELVEVPNVLGRQLDDAVSLLEARGFIVGLDYDPQINPSGSVTSQDPPSGTKLNKGSRVNLIVDAVEP